MQRGFFIAGVAGAAAEQKLAIISHNIANANTVGYRQHRTAFATYLAKTVQFNGLPAAYLQHGKQFVDLASGTYRHTGNPLDLAIHGDGFFKVALDDGKLALTRAGNFKLDRDRQLVTENGHPVLDTSGQPIRLPVGEVAVRSDGNIAVNGNPIGRLALVFLQDPEQVSKLSGALITTPESNMTDASSNAQIVQGELESSNVNPVLAMAEMIDVMRGYRTTMKIIEQYRNIEQQLSERVGVVRG